MLFVIQVIVNNPLFFMNSLNHTANVLTTLYVILCHVSFVDLYSAPLLILAQLSDCQFNENFSVHQLENS